MFQVRNRQKMLFIENVTSIQICHKICHTGLDVSLKTWKIQRSHSRAPVRIYLNWSKWTYRLTPSFVFNAVNNVFLIWIHHPKMLILS